jgi:hypothetical protein
MKSAERLYFPHIVETALPEGSKRLADMHSFHRRHGIQARPVSIGHDEKGRELFSGILLSRRSPIFSKSNLAKTRPLKGTWPPCIKLPRT